MPLLLSSCSTLSRSLSLSLSLKARLGCTDAVIVSMESQNKASLPVMDGLERRVASRSEGARTCDLLLRVLALVLTLAAAIVLGVDKQTKVVPIKILDTLPPISLPVSAKWHYLPAFTYSVASNAIACSYAALSLALSVSGKKGMMSIVVVLDLLMVALLFSSNGAALAIGLMGYQGNSHVRWTKVCNVFGRFCNQVAVSISLSLLGSIVFLLLVGITSLRLLKKSK
ncbi:CASP-like protein 1E1 [Populus alba x Populus x berolinensis]|nr:CASP-like protein 1E1 [Populus alba x Populus x berolinensis]